MKDTPPLLASLMLILLCSIFNDVIAQNVAINATGNPPNASAMIDISATDKGLLIPRVTYCQRVTAACAGGMLDAGGLLAAAAQGLMVYQKDAGTEGQGFYFNTSATTTPTWTKLFGGVGTGGIYAGSGSIPTGTTTVTLAGNTLDFTSSVIDGFSVDGTTFSVDAASNRVGIGNASPSEKLHVTGDFRVSTGQINSGGASLRLMEGVRADDASYEWLGFYSGTTRQGIILYDGSWSGANSMTNEFSITAENNNNLSLNTGPGEHILLMPKGTGNVGVGTTSPSTKLDVVGVLELSDVVPTDPGSDIVRLGDAGTNLRIQTNYGYTTIGPSNASWSHFGTDRARFYFNKGITVDQGLMGSYNEDLSLQTSGTTRISVLNSNGYVGIADVTPSEMLDVAGNIRASGTAYWGSSGTRTETMNDAGALGGRSGYYQTSAPAPASDWPAGASSWWHLLDVRHSNTANNYSMQIAGSFFNQDFWVRKTNNSATTAWAKMITTANIGSYADNLGNHTATTNLNMANNEIDAVNYVNITAGAGLGLRFWSSNNYAINMGSGGEWAYGAVTGYSIKTNMNNDPTRGWSWGVDGVAPVASINTQGIFSLANRIQIDGSTVIDDGAGWHRSYGATGWYNGTYGGGIYMSDATWIRTYGSKSFYHDVGIMRTDGTFQCGASGSRFIVQTGGAVGVNNTGPSGMFDVKGISYFGDWGVTSTTNRLTAGWYSGTHPMLRPEAANIGYVGTSANYFYYMYSNNYVNVSKRELKRNIIPINENKALSELIMEDIDRLKPSFYKYNSEYDEIIAGQESFFRPQMHLGVITDESPDYIQDQQFSGIDIYAIATLGVLGVKHNRSEINNLKEAMGITTINVSDFGSGQIDGNSIWVDFNDDFLEKLTNSPTVTVTPMISGASLYISEVTKKGFRVVNENSSSTFSSDVSFNWIAMSKYATAKEDNNINQTIPEDLKKQLYVSKEKKSQIKDLFNNELKLKASGGN